MMPLASQLVSIGYLLLLGAIWGFLWEFLEALFSDRKKRAVLLFAFMLPISSVLWYISNGGALRYYVPISVTVGILVFSLISRRTIGSTLALGIKRITGSIWLILNIVWIVFKLAIESVGLLTYSIFRKTRSGRVKTASNN
ncbi:MAG: hypothetical protein PHD88_05130 [Firmicutes bacterium]|nr:hypothetical protein [Bacillota bacterium]MDD4263780.1 hypothetical protein [Bacillota bacterium]MDD4693770.1 hypothetical protein [Bacillota bacterium]